MVKTVGRFTEFDILIIRRIGEGYNTLTRLCRAPKVLLAAEGLVAVNHRGQKEPERVLDRRLQALRKAEKIRYEKGLWRVVGP